MKVDVIIPVYKPGKQLFALLDKLGAQTVPIGKIILMNTEENYFQQLIDGTSFMEKYKNISVYHVSKREFDHGKTRREGVKHSDAPIFVMMTQDAMPANEHMLEHLVCHLEKDRRGDGTVAPGGSAGDRRDGAASPVAIAYARQLPNRESSILERFTRQFNYPSQSRIKSVEDLPKLGIKTFFCSNVCAAYRRDIYEELGGFIRHTIFNEDMIYASTAVRAGYRIAYEAEARVFHSHNYNCRQQFHRNFDLGVSQADHPEVFGGIASESEGRRMVGAAYAYLKRKHLLWKLPYFYLQCFCKYAGYLLGKHYEKLPRKLVLSLTMSPEYWEKD